MALSASIAYHGPLPAGPRPLPAFTKNWHGGKGQRQLTLWLISAYSSVGWITIVICGSVFGHLWVKKMAELDQLNGIIILANDKLFTTLI